MDGFKLAEGDEQIRLIFMGCGVLAINLLNGLLASRELTSIVGVLPASNVKRYRYLQAHPAEISLLKLAKENRLNVLDATSVNSASFGKALSKLKPHVILVGGWSEIVKPHVIGTEGLTIINCHGSLLPKYRGACPYLATIFNGDKATGFSFHLIDEGVDTGDILFQEKVDVEQGETALQLSERIAKKFGKAVSPLIRDLVDGKIIPRKQTGEVSCVSDHQPEWGWIPWEMDPSTIDQRMRALHGFLPLVTSLNGMIIGFNRGRVVSAPHPPRTQLPPDLLRFEPNLRTGMVVANQAEKIVVATRDPKFVVELDKPIVFPSGRMPLDVVPGDQFFSVECKSILKSA